MSYVLTLLLFITIVVVTIYKIAADVWTFIEYTPIDWLFEHIKMWANSILLFSNTLKRLFFFNEFWKETYFFSQDTPLFSLDMLYTYQTLLGSSLSNQPSYNALPNHPEFNVPFSLSFFLKTWQLHKGVVPEVYSGDVIFSLFDVLKTNIIFDYYYVKELKAKVGCLMLVDSSVVNFKKSNVVSLFNSDLILLLIFLTLLDIFFSKFENKLKFNGSFKCINVLVKFVIVTYFFILFLFWSLTLLNVFIIIPVFYLIINFAKLKKLNSLTNSYIVYFLSSNWLAHIKQSKLNYWKKNGITSNEYTHKRQMHQLNFAANSQSNKYIFLRQSFFFFKKSKIYLLEFTMYIMSLLLIFLKSLFKYTLFYINFIKSINLWRNLFKRWSYLGLFFKSRINWIKNKF